MCKKKNDSKIKYNLVCNKNRMDIVGNILFVNDNHQQFPKTPNINIILDPSEIENLVETDTNMVISINDNDDFKKATTLIEIYDYFNVPYAFATDEEIEEYYLS